MDLSVQIFTGSCMKPVEINTRAVIDKLNKIIKKKNISNAIIGWNKDADLSEIISLLKGNGADIYLWLPVFSELEALTDFFPLVKSDNKELKINYDAGNGEKFLFSCPANFKNIEKIIAVFEKYYGERVYDGVFLDKIRFPSFIGGLDSVLTCFCDYCRSKHDLPKEWGIHDSENPLGIRSYNNLSYNLDDRYKKLFDYKCDAVFNSLEYLCRYFRGRGLKIGFDLFAPFLAYFVGQSYHRLLHLADFVKPMFYGITNAPAGLPFEIDMYAKAFDDDTKKAERRKERFFNNIGYGKDFITSEITGIRKLMNDNGFKTRLYAGIEVNHITGIAPVTEKYICESVARAEEAGGIVASWDLNTMQDSHIDCMLGALAV